MSEIGKARLMEERKNWRKEHPFRFVAKPSRDSKSGVFDLFNWECKIPGKEGTLWEGGIFRMVMQFPEEYPNKPPKCVFKPCLFHPNIYPSGTVCLSILSEDEDWKPSLSVSQILLGIQDLLGNPNPNSPAQHDPFALYKDNRKKYNLKVREFVRMYGKN
ncbi:unnamed protein product [Moneuplotes crassus]|uniref:SUMO-conjugating enzyme UBC9 n=1 Tax=Euplotes crassus TaxID=5936 RepID=A0AAD2D5Q4_EUPCR|nr:unnamed protein product [Moneuplotes crassus]